MPNGKRPLLEQISAIAIAAGVAALLTFLTELVKGLSGLDITVQQQAASSGGGVLAYLKAARFF